MSNINFVLSRVEHGKRFITSFQIIRTLNYLDSTVCDFIGIFSVLSDEQI